ncbi:MAG: DUF3556 domain-containing protein [Kofleriaceae bacterium]
MGFLAPTLPPYDPEAWARSPFPDRARAVCQAWAAQGYGAPVAVYLAYVLKVGLYVGGWLAWCWATPALGGPSTIAGWWAHPVAFEKAILWSMLYEGLGLGCGSGPLTGRYLPPVGGALYFARPKTTRLPPWPRLPGTAGHRRTVVDVALYLAIIGALLVGLAAAAPPRAALLVIAAGVPVLGLRDRTTFLAFRSEHYWLTVVVLAATPTPVAGAKAIQLALWGWAGVSKLNHHFPSVVCVMISNSPVARWGWLRRAMYRAAPDDLRPSRLATGMAHAGTALELAVPLVLGLASGGTGLVVGLVLMVVLHAFITVHVPMGVPLEWNVMVVYGGFALFGAHPDVSVAQAITPDWVGLVVAAVVVVPLIGNLAPRWVSFLPSMRYYAGNWAWSVWLFRGDAHRKLEALTKSSAWPHEQLARLYPGSAPAAMMSLVMGFRLMHLHGRALPQLVPQAVDDPAAYQWADGELVAGLALGWNFGDGHLHHGQLLAAIQAQCGFAPGELRCIFGESEAAGAGTLPYQIVDAATGPLTAGTVAVADLRGRQPWGAVVDPGPAGSVAYPR